MNDKVNELIEAAGLKAVNGKIKVGCIDYAISIVDLLEDDDRLEIFGQCAYDECEIRILERLALLAKVATLWHEIAHAILIDAGYINDHDEPMVSAIAHGITSVLKNNK